MAEVFVSYSQKDRALVTPIGTRLAALGVDVWFDRDIVPAERFGAAIRARLKEAKVVLVCWSPEAVESSWVNDEAEYASDIGTYLPIYAAPCVLMPPFNRIHTENMSNWAESASDPAWLKLVERIAELLGRKGVSAAAKALATGDNQTLYKFAQRFPEEPVAQRIWSDAEAKHRSEFQSCLEEAKAAVAARAARIATDAAELQLCLDGQTAAFDDWLAEERRGATAKPRPDPLATVRRFVPAEEKKLQDEIAALRSALAQANGVEEEVEATKREIARLSEQLAEKSTEEQRLREEMARLSEASVNTKAGMQELETAKAEVARLSGESEQAKAEITRVSEDLAARDRLSKLKGADKIIESPTGKETQLDTKPAKKQEGNVVLGCAIMVAGIALLIIFLGVQLRWW